MLCLLSELEQSVEQSKKDYQTLKEESRSREEQLVQVGRRSLVEISCGHLSAVKFLYST